MTPDIDGLKARLDAKRCRLLFAAESGSRAWGFASPDSDYDVRFVYAKDIPSYLRLNETLQTVEYKSGDDDMAGWDLRKALGLAQKSNPSLAEWLKSPVVYHDDAAFRTSLRTLFEMHFNPRGLAHHYVNFMRNIRGKYLEDWTGEYTLKRYFYALRPIFVIMWMREHPWKLAPVEFPVVSDAVCPAELRGHVATLLERKRVSTENMAGERIQDVDRFIAEWFERGHDIAQDFPVRQFPVEPLDKLFLDMVGYERPAKAA